MTLDDADRLLELLQNLSEEATKWSMAPYKLEWVQHWLKTPKLYHVAAEKGGKLIGFVCIEEWTHSRRKGNSYLGAYIHRDHEDTELLSILLQQVLDKARDKELHKVNAEIVAEHKTSFDALKRHGFQIEGRKRDSFHGEDNKYHDVVIMGKILDNMANTHTRSN